MLYCFVVKRLSSDGSVDWHHRCQCLEFEDHNSEKMIMSFHNMKRHVCDDVSIERDMNPFVRISKRVQWWDTNMNLRELVTLLREIEGKARV